MSDAWIQYVEDPRTICRYGSKCYQKNPQHLSQFKHPPHSKRKPTNNHTKCKRTKIEQQSPKPGRVEVPDSDESVENESIEDANPSIRGDSPIVRPDASKVHLAQTAEEKPARENVSPVAKEVTFMDTDADGSKLIKELFMVDMPEDFYSFWKFLSNENVGMDLLKSINLKLIGPFDVLSGNLPQITDRERYLVHWRFFYDPPEFQAIIKSDGQSEFHIGYYRDSPNEKPVFVGSNDSSKNCMITPLAENIFGALYVHLQAEKRKSPFTAISYQKVSDKLKAWAEEHSFPLAKYDTRRRLASEAVTRCFHGAGVVVPYNKSTQLGYRPLVESDASIKKMLSELSSAKSDEVRDKILSSLQPVITYANIAVDECDFGTGLELGIDLFCSGLPELDATVTALLTTSYSLLNRHEFIKIAQAHLKYRRKGVDLSVLNLQ